MRRFLLTFAFFLASLTAFSQGAQVTQVGAIYAIGSKLLQRVYVPSVSDSEIDAQFVGPGEWMTKVPLITYQIGGAPAVQSMIGTPTFSGICAVVDKGTNTVLNMIIADPALYADPNGNSVIPSDLAQVGDTWDGAHFKRRYVEINPNAPTALTAIVSSSMQPIDNPVPGTAGNVMMTSPTMNVGDLLDPALFLKLKALAAALN